MSLSPNTPSSASLRKQPLSTSPLTTSSGLPSTSLLSLNAEHCHHFNDEPGDLPNFQAEVKWDGPPEILDDLKTDDDLEAWPQELQSTGATTR
jgi:hypothetical protein